MTPCKVEERSFLPNEYFSVVLPCNAPHIAENERCFELFASYVQMGIYDRIINDKLQGHHVIHLILATAVVGYTMKRNEITYAT